jgi:hypothetical protein
MSLGNASRGKWKDTGAIVATNVSRAKLQPR